MNKILSMLILGSLITGCQSGQSDSSKTPDRKTVTNNMQLTIEYSADEYSGNLAGTDSKPIGKGSYSTSLTISPQATITDLVSAFHKTTGLATSYKFWGGVPPNRTSSDVSYDHIINGTLIDDDNENMTLTEFGITDNNPITMVITGGGLVD